MKIRYAFVLGGCMVLLVVAGVYFVLKYQPSDREQFLSEIAGVSYGHISAHDGSIDETPVDMAAFEDAMSRCSIEFRVYEGDIDFSPDELLRLRMTDGRIIDLGWSGGWYGVDMARNRTITVGYAGVEAFWEATLMRASGGE